MSRPALQGRVTPHRMHDLNPAGTSHATVVLDEFEEPGAGRLKKSSFRM